MKAKLAKRSASNADLDELAQKYAGSSAALEFGSNYFTIYDRLDKTLGRASLSINHQGQPPHLC